MVCSKCGAPQPDNASFCDKCGAPITPATYQAPPAYNPVPPAAPMYNNPGYTPAPRKPMEPNKLVLLIGMISLAVIALFAMITVFSDSIDYDTAKFFNFMTTLGELGFQASIVLYLYFKLKKPQN